jgi:hypothetical protein
VRPIAKAHPLERRTGDRTVGAGGPPPPRQSRERAHQRDVERRHRVVEPRPVGLRHRARATVELDRPAERRELAEQRAEQRRLATAVRAEQRDPLARVHVDRHARDRRPAVVARAQVLGAQDHRAAHPVSPPVNPSTIESALCCCISA